MKSTILILLVAIAMISGCDSNSTTTTTTIGVTTTTLITTTTVPNDCTDSSECTTGGCSSQLCVKKTGDIGGGIFTTCEYKKEYDCLKLTKCECIDSICKWNENDAYKECMTNINN